MANVGTYAYLNHTENINLKNVFPSHILMSRWFHSDSAHVFDTRVCHLEGPQLTQATLFQRTSFHLSSQSFAVKHFLTPRNTCSWKLLPTLSTHLCNTRTVCLFDFSCQVYISYHQNNDFLCCFSSKACAQHTQSLQLWSPACGITAKCELNCPYCLKRKLSTAKPDGGSLQAPSAGTERDSSA